METITTTSESAKPPAMPWAIRNLPAFPAVATKLLQLLSDEEVSMRQVIALIRSDPAFSAEILRVANSALFGRTSRIDSVMQAMVILGLDRVKKLTLTGAMGSYLKVALRVDVLRRCWRHSLACGLLSEELAQAVGFPKDAAYTAGLLHDMGRLGLLVAYPREYANLLAVTEENSFDLIDSERQLFDIDHCEAGRWLMAEWKFPEEFQNIAAKHHADPPAGEEFNTTALVHYACLLSDTLGFGALEKCQAKRMEDIVAALPRSAQYLFPSNADELREKITNIVDSLV